VNVDDNHGMKVVHFAQLDKDSILLCAESEYAATLKFFCVGHKGFRWLFIFIYDILLSCGYFVNGFSYDSWKALEFRTENFKALTHR